ncbi:MAG: 4-hydroxy-3-methylbut-2-enyl diphosphate reductase [Planctomycetota bacterium]|nr:MAG: 4-hydroxy-3-methylbut-2-enyl diphosphate reductase [Planctomycetota bacterium]
MRILLVSPRGFCAGVNMAIDALERAIAMFGTPLYVYHEIVHNRRVVEQFREKGVVFVDDVHEVPQGSHLMYSAHGVSPGVRLAAQRRGLQVVDATCPLVRKVHLEAVRFAELGYSLVLIGHRDHDEVVGTMGEAPGQITLVESVADVDRLQVPDPDKVAYLTQTTLSVDDAGVIIDRLKQRFPNCVGSPKEDICYATQNRQEALKAGVTQADVVLVFGSKNSSNSIRLTEVAAEFDTPAHLVDNVTEIDPAWFGPEDTVLITAGASAPEELVEDCIAYLERTFQATVEQLAVREENVEFPLPYEIRPLPPSSRAPQA